ncbi:hypothetical protein Bca4012_077589 [Brassica carinata]|uniref:Uncharacterized protein n=1 Tax=Brassica carinata TaxID=52824 RepID=A0A8X7Q7I7_BRACI|nr:hypothetical protein Bca52824_072275 [Brassica carinata]
MHSMELFDEIQNVKWFGALSVLTLVMLMSYHQLLWKESVDDKSTWVKDVNNLSLVKDPSLAKPLGRNVFLCWIINSSLEITVGIKEDTVIRLSLNPLRRNKNQKLLMVSAAR